jgi:hypothetical protein
MNLRLVFVLPLFFVGFRFFSATPIDSTSSKKQISLIIKADLLALGYDVFTHKKPAYQKYYSFSIEKLLGKNHGVQLSYYFAPFSSTGVKWYVISPEYKFFVSKKKQHTGYYIGANLKYIHYYEKSSWVAPQSISDTTYYGKYESYNIGAGLINGFQFYLWNRISFDFLAGIGFFAEIKNKQYQPYYLLGGNHLYGFAFSRNADIRLALNIGFKF